MKTRKVARATRVRQLGGLCAMRTAATAATAMPAQQTRLTRVLSREVCRSRLIAPRQRRQLTSRRRPDRSTPITLRPPCAEGKDCPGNAGAQDSCATQRPPETAGDKEFFTRAAEPESLGRVTEGRPSRDSGLAYWEGTG